MDRESLELFRKHLSGAYYHQDWKVIEPTTAYGIGVYDGERSGVVSGQANIGTLAPLLELDISRQRFAGLCRWLEMNHDEDAPGQPSFRELWEGTLAGFLDVLGSRMLALLNEGEEIPLDPRAHIRTNVFEPYFYEGWRDFHPDPHELGKTIAAALPSESADRALGFFYILNSLEIPDTELDNICKRLGYHCDDGTTGLTTRQIIEKTRDGMRATLTEQALSLINELEIGLPEDS